MKKRLLSFFLIICFVFMNVYSSVSAFSINEDKKSEIEETLNKLKNHYKNSQNNMEYLELMAYLHLSNDLENNRRLLKEKVQYPVNNKNVRNCFKGIFICSALQSHSKTYTDGLSERYNKVKHNFDSQDDINAKCILALDMVGADYDKNECLKALINNFNRNKNINKSAAILLALAKHKDIPEINEGIKRYKDHIKSLQKDDGGFGNMGENGIVRYYPPASAISEVIQALIAIGEDPLSNEWTKNGKNMLDALMQYKMDDGTFSADKIIKNSSWGIKQARDENATRSAFAALADLYKGSSMYQCNNETSKPVVDTDDKEDKHEAEKRDKAKSIDVVIDGTKVEDNFKIKVNEEKKLDILIKNEQNEELKDSKISFSTQKNLIKVENKKIIATKEGNDKLTITCGDISKTINIEIVKEKSEEKPLPQPSENPSSQGKEEILDRKEKIINTIKELKAHYSDKEKPFNYLETLALIYSGTFSDTIKNKVEIHEYDIIKCLAENIMAIKAIGEDPANYKGKNYISLLLNPKEKGSNDDYISTISKKIIALDMAGVNYNKEELIKDLMHKYNKDNIDDFSNIVLAISNHRDIKGVPEFIERYKKYIKDVQLDNGSFKNSSGLEDSGELGLVIQTLVAIGENPLSTKWCKTNEKGEKITLIDVLLRYKKGSQFKLNNNKWTTEASSICTSRAFAALADTLRCKSMYTNIANKELIIKNIEITSNNDLNEIDLNHNLQLNANVFDYLDNKVLNEPVTWSSDNNNVANVDENGLVKPVSEGNVKITATLKRDKSINNVFNIKVIDKNKAVNVQVVKATNMKNGKDAFISIKAINNSLNSIDASVIIALYDKSNDKMVTYVANKKDLKSKRDEAINAGFTIPKEGNFIFKVLVWKDIDDNIPYSNPKLLSVER